MTQLRHRAGRAGLLLLAAAGLAVPSGPAAAAYRPSCSSGVYAPQVCTFVLSTVVARFAAAGQWAVVTAVRPTVAAPRCASGATGWVEQFRGSARTTVEGRSVIGTVSLTLYGCPDEQPTVVGAASYVGPEQRGFAHNAQRYPYRTVDVTVRPGAPVAAVSIADRRNWPGSDGRIWHGASGTLFRRDTGMSTDAEGQTDYCESPASNGTCNYNGHFGPVTVAVDSSVSGRWSRLQVALDSSLNTEDATTRVTAQPYGSGWKVTRVP